MGTVNFPLSCLVIAVCMQKPRENARNASIDISASYLRLVFDHLVLGAELFVEWRQPVPSSKTISLSSWRLMHSKPRLLQMGLMSSLCESNVQFKPKFWSDVRTVFLILKSLQWYKYIYSFFIDMYIHVNMAISMWINLYSNRFLLGFKIILDPSGLQIGNKKIEKCL
uniref:Uncharacterized protein n=1 Tax=Glossina palpalis gambiensis TaxID=67801 RepID=A0A1B0ATW6_9MUSC